MLNGKKSYISAGVLFLIGGFLYIGVITQEQANSFAIMAAGLLGASLKSAIKKAE